MKNRYKNLIEKILDFFNLSNLLSFLMKIKEDLRVSISTEKT